VPQAPPNAGILDVPDPPAPSATTGREQELIDSSLDWLQVNVLKLIALRVVPLIVTSGVVTASLAWSQRAIGMNLPPAVVASFVLSVMSGVVLTAFAYVRNHAGATQLGKAVLELLSLRIEMEKTGAIPLPPRAIGGDKP
jgi:hypothetical protein